MSLLDVDSWSMEFEACERLSQSLLQQLAQRQQRPKFSPEYDRLTASIQVGLQQYDTELRQLKDKLGSRQAAQTTLSQAEIERRSSDLDALDSKLSQLRRKFTTANRSDRVALLEQPSASSSVWQDDAPIIDTSTAAAGNKIDVNLPVEVLRRKQIELLEDQNRGLDALSRTISRQRELASRLGNEVEDQNDLLDNLADTMERVDTRVHMATGGIGNINRADGTCGYWTIIIALFIAIVLVATIL